MSNNFLTAEWRKLTMANYAVDPQLLSPYLPYKTELDLWKGTCYVSLVGFMFLNTRLKGIKIPFHTHFEEVNLRFYVRFKDKDQWKRGVVFIKEIVPRPALTWVANTIYKENYETMPMEHNWEIAEDTLEVEYRWKKKRWNSFRIQTSSKPEPIVVGSEEEFITEHYWGYARINSQRTTEYEVVHPRWEVYPTIDYKTDVDFEGTYGSAFKFLNHLQPTSVFLAEGSEIAVKKGAEV
ncbi:MAG: DUF2071 domain-containing protein [Cyclobacteriaceae bacterium]